MLTLLNVQFPTIEVSSIVNEIFQGAGFEKILWGIKGLAFTAIVYYTVSLFSKMMSGKETFNPSSFAPVIIYALLIVNWNWFNGEIDEGFKAVGKAFEASTPTDSRSNAKYQEIILKWQKIPSSGLPPDNGSAPVVAEPEEKGRWEVFKDMKESISEIASIINHPEVFSLKIAMFFVYIFNQCILMLFNAFSYIWINLLRIGGIVAATLYFFPTMKGAFTNWLKTYASVYLWIPLGSIMIYVSDQIFLRVVELVPIPDLYGGVAIAGIPVIDSQSMTRMALIVITAIATTILKLILLSKVPNIISYWVNGGSTGDMFSTSSAFVMSGATATMGAAKVGAEVASGGASGGSLASSGLSDMGGSLKGDNK